MIRSALALVLLLSACGNETPPQPDDEVTLVYPVMAVGTEGWTPLIGGDVALVGWELDDDEDEWVSRAGVLDAARQELWIEGPDGERPELVVPEWGIRPGRQTIRLPGEHLAPGTWTWHIQVDGEDFETGSFEITAHGQADSFDPAVLDGTLWALDGEGESLEWFGPTGQEHYLEPVYLHLRARGEDVDVMAYASLAGRQQLCRVWSGSGTVDEGGFLVAAVPPSLDGPLPLHGGELRMGFLDGQDAVGLGFAATVDVSVLDPAFSDTDGPVSEGAACEVGGSVGVPCEPCPSGDSEDCLTVRTFSGVPESLTESELLGRFDGSPGTLDQVPACDTPEQGGVSVCSVLGTAGMSAWFLGVGALLLRRRRTLSR